MIALPRTELRLQGTQDAPPSPASLLLAGPNGAGKTNFINGFLRERAEAFQFVNPDEVARHLPPGPGRDLAALSFVILRQAAQRRRPGDPAARGSANLSRSRLCPGVAFGAAGSPDLAALVGG